MENAISTSSIWYEAWTIIQPIVTLLVSVVGPVLVTWISARLISLLKISDDAKKAEVEARLRDALHQSALNAVKYAAAKSGFPAGIPSANVVNTAIEYVKEKNPEALEKLGVTHKSLEDIIISKMPDVLSKTAVK